jgi:UDP-galactopyranose mutase
MTQFGQYFNPSKFMDKNIVVKMLLHSGDEVIYPVPLKKNQKRVQSIQSTYNNVYFAGWQANYTFLSIAESIQQASKVAGQIKHFVHN